MSLGELKGIIFEGIKKEINTMGMGKMDLFLRKTFTRTTSSFSIRGESTLVSTETSRFFRDNRATTKNKSGDKINI
jgi:hypothetical protein